MTKLTKYISDSGVSSIQASVSTYNERFHVSPDMYIPDPPSPDLRIVVVVPAFREKEILFLNDLKNCVPPALGMELIIVANDYENHATSVAMFEKTQRQSTAIHVDNLRIHVIQKFDFDIKKHGVGMARKLGMDEALKRFGIIDHNGWIVCLDADCTISKNYFRILEDALKKDFTSATLHFEHPYHHLDEAHQCGILSYELFLRYYKECLKWAGFPYYFHTVGSSMAVRAETYAKVGGMNKRKAGEDFYFMHKVFPMGPVQEINAPLVFPSPRISSRVPFGTGRAMLNWQHKENRNYLTYPFEIFVLLKEFLSGDGQWQYENPTIHTLLQECLADLNFETKLSEIRRKSTTPESFIKNFYQLVNGFTVLKMVHFLRDRQFGEVDVETGAKDLLQNLGISPEDTIEKLVLQFRNLQMHGLHS